MAIHIVAAKFPGATLSVGDDLVGDPGFCFEACSTIGIGEGGCRSIYGALIGSRPVAANLGMSPNIGATRLVPGTAPDAVSLGVGDCRPFHF